MSPARLQLLLPHVFQLAARSGSPLAGLLGAMDAVHAPLERALARSELVASPGHGGDAFVEALAHWLGLGELLFEPPRAALSDEPPRPPAPLVSSAELRRVVADWELGRRQRGTLPGLARLLRLALSSDRVMVAPADDRPFHVWVDAPAALQPRRRLIERIVRAEKPAHVTHGVRFAAEPKGGTGAAEN